MSFDLEGYAIILQMYSAYQLYIENKSLYQDTKAYYENELKISNERLLLKDETIKILSEDREFIYQRMNKTLDEVAKEERRNKIRIILFSTGGVLVGTGIGILIGAFLIK
jgi:ATP-dependent protease ClpP protease subunit